MSSHTKHYVSSLEQALHGLVVPPGIRRMLTLVDVDHVGFDEAVHTGQLVVHQSLANEVKDIFSALYAIRFPIAQVVPINVFNWNDEASMEANNSSAFNYRHIIGTQRLSNHSFGRAIDINPMQNPYYARDGRKYPAASSYDVEALGTLTSNSEAVAIFKSRGWVWGGDWTVPVDFQHFEKPLA